jgi:LysW-gamma-L-lysine carboxypeptidase
MDTVSLISSNETAPYATLLGLVSRYSPSGEEKEVVDWLVERMRFLEYKRAYRDAAGNAVGVIGDGPNQVVLLGHIDSVPGQIPVRVEGDILYGRGSVDAKGPLASFVDAAAHPGPPAGWQYVVIGCVEEERDSEGARFVAEHYHPAAVIVGEPSGWDRLTLGYKGSAWAEINLKQSLAHTASLTPSVCEMGFELWKAIKDWTETYNLDQERTFDKVSPTLRRFASGEDGFQEWARLRIGARLPLALKTQDWYKQLDQIMGQISLNQQAGPDLDIQMTPTGFAIPAYLGEKNTPLVRAFLSGIRSVQGQPGFLLKSGTADMNIVAPLWGCPAVAYGPGDSSLDHTPNEKISLDEYKRSVQVVRQVLHEISNGL